jgi:FlaA1/EpsC-like NDP-sugar epimerase
MKDKKILIIGGTGALGKTLVKRYCDSNEIIVLSRDEHKHYHLQKEYPNVHSIIGDVKDKSSIKNCLLRFTPHVVINAAALKHVPICEDDPFESVKTNIIGHQNIIESVSEVGFIETLILFQKDYMLNMLNREEHRRLC